MLTITRDYFELESGIARRLYELARKHVGAQPQWRIGLDKLAAKVGTSRAHAFSSATCFASWRRTTCPITGCR